MGKKRGGKEGILVKKKVLVKVIGVLFLISTGKLEEYETLKVWNCEK